MKLPKEIKIGNRKVPVHQKKGLTVNDKPVMGYYDLTDPAIYIDKNMKPLAIVETFWHELMHAIFDYTRFGVDMVMELEDEDSHEVDAYKIEERAAESFAKVLLQVLADNDLANIK